MGGIFLLLRAEGQEEEFHDLSSIHKNTFTVILTNYFTIILTMQSLVSVVGKRGLGLLESSVVARQFSSLQKIATTEEQIAEVAHGKTQSEPQITVPGQAFPGDYRSTSALGVGDGLSNHTAKWWSGEGKTPMEYCQSAEPIKVEGMTVASTGSDEYSLGCPVEYISLKGTTKENPAVCKYTGLKYYSDAWKHGGHH